MKIPPTITALVRSTDSFSLISRRDPPRPWIFAPPAITTKEGFSGGSSHGTKAGSEIQEDGGSGSSAMQVDEMGQPSSQSGLNQGDGQGDDGTATAAHGHSMAYTGPVLLSRAPDSLSYIHTCTGYLDVAHDDIFASSGIADLSIYHISYLYLLQPFYHLHLILHLVFLLLLLLLLLRYLIYLLLLFLLL